VLCGHALQASTGRHARANKVALVNRVLDVFFDSVDPVRPNTRAWLVMFDAPTIDRCDPMAPPEHYFRINAATIDLAQKRSPARD